MSKQTAGERIAEDWACGRLPGTVAETIDEACAKAKAFSIREMHLELMNAYNWAHRGNNYYSRTAEDLIIKHGGIVVTSRKRNEIEGDQS